MKSVQIVYFAVLREQRGLSRETITTDAATCGELYGQLRRSFGFTLPPALVRLAVNGEFRESDQGFADGDEVVLIPPVAGG